LTMADPHLGSVSLCATRLAIASRFTKLEDYEHDA